MMRRAIPTGVIVAGLMAFLAGTLACIVIAAGAVAYDPRSTNQGSTRASLVITLLGTIVLVNVLATLLWVGIDRRRRGDPTSALYWPVVAIALSLVCYLAIAGGPVVDFLAHDLRPTWTYLYNPSLKIVQATFLLAVFLSFAWFAVLLLRDWPRRRLVLLCAAMVAETALIVGIVLFLAGRGAI
jgi:hypothetical protein